MEKYINYHNSESTTRSKFVPNYRKFFRGNYQQHFILQQRQVKLTTKMEQFFDVPAGRTIKNTTDSYHSITYLSKSVLNKF